MLGSKITHFIEILQHFLAQISQQKSHHETVLRDKQRIAQGVRKFMEKNYELRYNILKQTEEFREKSIHHDQSNSDENYIGTDKNFIGSDGAESNTGWKQLTDRELRKISHQQMEQVGVAWSVDVELYVRSALVPDYNPVTDYLNRCGAWDGSDRIRELAQHVPCTWAQWPDHFHRWFLGMVAQWQQRSRDYGNALVPLLIGNQGTHKSTFCKLLLPPHLREYYIDDIKLDNAEQVERMLGRMLLVNIDEYNAKTEREQAKIKRVLTERDVQTRRMRSDQYVMLPRMASFIATTNDSTPLTDPTGSRRYLCCDINGIIDTDVPIDYRQLYAQAVAELDAGHAWYFSKEEEQVISQHNQQFRCQSSTESVLLSCFEPAPRSKQYFIRSVDIQQELSHHVRATDIPNLKTLTLALKACHFLYGSYDGHRGWYAHKICESH